MPSFPSLVPLPWQKGGPVPHRPHLLLIRGRRVVGIPDGQRRGHCVGHRVRRRSPSFKPRDLGVRVRRERETKKWKQFKQEKTRLQTMVEYSAGHCHNIPQKYGITFGVRPFNFSLGRHFSGHGFRAQVGHFFCLSGFGEVID